MQNPSHVPFDAVCDDCVHIALFHGDNGKCKMCGNCSGFCSTQHTGKVLMNDVSVTPAVSPKQRVRLGVSGGHRMVHTRAW